ncbi:MAG: hypothetical protein WD960_04020 [Gemmatimonadota bacterium]
MILRPDHRRRIRMRTSEERDEAAREVDLHKSRVHLARPSKTEVPTIVVGLLGFLAGAIALQSLVGGVVGAVVALLIRGTLVRLL